MKRLYVKNVRQKGRGVFCKDLIARDELIEICPVLVIPPSDHDIVVSSRLCDYFFDFDKVERTLALALGFGSLYNHATRSNAAYFLDKENKVMEYYALEDIPPGREICINYGGEQGREFKEWFEMRNISYQES